MNERVWKFLRETLGTSDVTTAREAEAKAIAEAALGTIHPELVRDQSDLGRSSARALRQGSFAEGPYRGRDLLIAVARLLAHQLVLGESGSGKTFHVLHQVMSLLIQHAIASLFILDMKGELSELLTDVALPALAATLPAPEANALLNRIVVIDPFSLTHPPPLNVLVRDPSIPIAIQARDVAECFHAATETDSSVRMETILDWVLRLVIEVGGSFHAVRRALQEPAVLEGLVRQSHDAETIRYFVVRYPSEPKASKQALLARLDRFLALPMTQLCLGARYALDFDRLLQDCIVIVNLGRVPAGLQSVARFFAMVVLTRMVRAIFSRPPRSNGFASLLVADEWQTALNPALVAEFDSILTLARSRGVHAWLINQQLSQLDRHGAGLKSVVLAETVIQTVFRVPTEDARALRSMFPSTGTFRRRTGTGTPFLSPSEELDARMNGASRLPNRVGYWNDKEKPWGATMFTSATVNLPDPSTLPADYILRAQRGVVALTTKDLQAMRDDEDKRLNQLAAGPARAPVGGAVSKPVIGTATVHPSVASPVPGQRSKPRGGAGRGRPPRVR